MCTGSGGSSAGMAYGIRKMGGKEVEAFLSMLANVRQVSPSTHRQALSAILFLYKEVLDPELPWLQDIGRPVPTKRIPVVLTREEVRQVLSLMDGVTGLLGAYCMEPACGCAKHYRCA